MRLFRYDDPTVKPDLSRLNDHSRFRHKRYQHLILDLPINEGGGPNIYNAAFTGASVESNSVYASRNERGLVLSGIEGNGSACLNMPAGTQSFTWVVKCQTYDPGYLMDAETGRLIAIFNTTSQLQIYDGTFRSFTVSNAFDFATYFFEVNASSSECRVWKNLIPSASNPQSYSAKSLGGAIRLFSRFNFSSAGATWNGNCEFLRMYDRVLTEEERSSLTEAPYLEYYPQRQWWFVPAAGGGASAEGSAAVTGAGDVAATGNKQASRAAAVSGSGACAATGKKTGTGVVSLPGAGAIVTLGTKGAIQPSAIDGSGEITATGQKGGLGASAISGSGTIETTGTVQEIHSGASAISGSGDVQATGVKTGQRAVQLSASGQLQTQGHKSTTGQVAVSVKARLAALGVKHIGGVVSLSGGGAVQTTGSSIVVGNVMLWRDPALTLSGLSDPTLTLAGLTGATLESD